MTLEPIELHNILDESSATDDNYLRMRIGKLKAILLYQRKLENDVEELQGLLARSIERKKDATASELIQRKRAITLQNQLDLYDNIKLNVLG